MIYGYCVRLASDPAPAADSPGIQGRPVRAHRCGQLGVWVSEVEPPIEPSEERLREHERVVREALRSATPLPLRFGTAFVSLEAMEGAIEARGEALLRALDRVAGLVEMVIRVERQGAGQSTDAGVGAPSESVTPGAAATSGRAYLERRRAQFEAAEGARREADEILRDIEKSLGDVAVESAVSPSRKDGLVGRVACLVRRGDVPAFRTRVTGAIQAELPALRLGVTGPWAPYSFANE